MSPTIGMAQAQSQMPRYKCHKEVWALKILEVNYNPQTASQKSGGAQLVVEEPFAPLEVDGEYIDRHDPKAGGYYVQYDDSYTSFSPAEAFETGYTLMDGGAVPTPAQ